MSLVGVLTGWFRDLDFIAEDLGYPSPEVVQLLSDSGLPGMKVLEFAFDSRDPSDYLPHSCNFNSICYTGTHDNAPLALWRTEADKADIAFAKKYLGLNDEEGFNAGIIRGGMSCQSRLFVAQMQDYLGLGKGCRMNTPGTSSGNWQWRMLSGEASKKLAYWAASVATLSAASSLLLSAFGRDPVGELTGTIFTACVGYLITYAGKSLGEKISRNRHGLDADGNPLPDPSGDTLNNEEAKG